MTHSLKLAREDFITEALRAVNDAIGTAEPHEQAFKIIAAIKALRDTKARVTNGGVDYLRKVQEASQDAWRAEYGGTHGNVVTDDPRCTASAGIVTPIGRLRVVTWRTTWKGDRPAWASEYYLDDAPITVREIRAAGLAQRPTTRTRQSKKERR